MTEPKKSEIDQVISEYKEWVGQIRLFNNATLYVFLAFSALAGFGLWYLGFRGAWILVPIFFGVYILFELGKREGHMEGYMDGYFSGAGSGVHRVLGIDKEGAEFIDQITTDAQSAKRHNH